MGQPDSALIWIKESIAINPESHNGSEWIHIKILEFKLLQYKNYESSILGLDFGNHNIPENPEELDLEKLQRHIWHQLVERSKFVKPQNTIIGNIYFDLGNILAQTQSLEAALESYEAAIEYGFNSELLTARKNKFEALAIKAQPYQSRNNAWDFIRENIKVLFISGVLLFILFIAGMIFLIKKIIN